MNDGKPRILVADDEPNNLQLIRQILKDDYHLSFVTSGMKALEAVNTVAPDLVLLDIMMPGMDGYEVCTRLKADEKTKHIPVIFVSAMSESGDETKGFQIGAVDYITKPFNPDVVRARVVSVIKLKERTEQLSALSEKLSKYLSPQVYASIFSGERDVRIESSRKKLTVFFSDIVNFTSTTERMEPEDLSVLLNEYFDRMATVAIKHGGTLDKYMGDAIMVFFGDPQTLGVKEDALACVSMAMEMIEALKSLQKEWQQKGVMMPFRIRVGINTGFCTVGNFGSKTKMDYTIIGNQVNAAKRIQESAREDQIVISHETWAHVRDQIHCIRQKPVMVKGIAKPVQTWQVIGFHEQLQSSDYVIPIGILAEPAKTAGAETLVRDIDLGRRLNDSFNALVVVREEEPVGLLLNYHLTRILNSQSHRAQFFDQPVTEVMDTSPLTVETDTPVVKVAQQAVSRERDRIYDPIIVTEKGRLTGIVPVHSLLEKLTELCVSA